MMMAANLRPAANLCSEAVQYINHVHEPGASLDDYGRFRGMDISRKTYWRIRSKLLLFLLS